jgi:protein-disulfide isomerase
MAVEERIQSPKGALYTFESKASFGIKCDNPIDPSCGSHLMPDALGPNLRRALAQSPVFAYPSRRNCTVEIAMFAFRRREMIVAAALFAAGCGADSGAVAMSDADMSVGEASAPVTIIEYASVTCPHCAEFHHAVWPQLKANYIDTGRVLYVFREYPTPPAPIAVAGFQLARCGGASAEQYFERIGVLFEQQQAMFQALRAYGNAGARDKFLEIGAAAGLSREQVLDCVADEAGATRIRETVEAAHRDFDLTGTPTLILNGRKLEGVNIYNYDDVAAAIDAAISGE